ncbi:MAG: Ldh family oxidoreductase, partial [Myxococcota bacterium]
MERFKVPEDIAVRIAPDDMRATVDAIFQILGMPPDDAERSTDALIYADIRGIDSHGVSNMMPFYVTMLQSGFINPTPTLEVLREADAAATVDSDRGLGLTIGPQCMDLAMDKA